MTLKLLLLIFLQQPVIMWKCDDVKVAHIDESCESAAPLGRFIASLSLLFSRLVATLAFQLKNSKYVTIQPTQTSHH